MTTAVILDGAMGKKFGKQWDLCVDSPAEALRMIGCNKPAFPFWIRDNLATYEGYQVTCQYENGVTTEVGEEELYMNGKIVSIRFTPVLTGSGKTGMIILGAVIMIAAIVLTAGAMAAGVGFWATMGANALYAGMFLGGASMMVSGVVSALTPQPSMGSDMSSSRVDKTSYYFNGPANTTAQGVPVPLIYGTCLVGSHAISASLTIDDASDDVTAPTVTTYSPAAGATGVLTSANIVLTFSEAIIKGSGTIRIRSGSKSGAIVESFKVASSLLTSINSLNVTINPTNNLLPNTTYFVVIPSGTYKDWKGNKYIGTSTYSFTTGAV